ncbi:MAG: hypothetical protein LCH89_06400 [Proteobacteria bacterium]|jgi:predicted Zn-dependent protease|nr:hypothetical protein [Pseudomonadota bacterium]
MPAEPTDLPSAGDIRLLSAIGFIAAGRGDLARAEAIFGALLSLRPHKAVGHVGVAMALINRGRPAEAASRLAETVLSDTEENQMVRAVHGLALQLDRRPGEANRVLKAVAEAPSSTSESTAGVRLAASLLGTGSPAQAARMRAASVAPTNPDGPT